MQMTTIVEANCVKKLEIPRGMNAATVLEESLVFSSLNLMLLRRGM